MQKYKFCYSWPQASPIKSCLSLNTFLSGTCVALYRIFDVIRSAVVNYSHQRLTFYKSQHRIAFTFYMYDARMVFHSLPSRKSKSFPLTKTNFLRFKSSKDEVYKFGQCHELMTLTQWKEGYLIVFIKELCYYMKVDQWNLIYQIWTLINASVQPSQISLSLFFLDRRQANIASDNKYRLL